MFDTNFLNKAEFYDFSAELVSPTKKAKIDFSTTVLPARKVDKNPFTQMAEIINIRQPPQTKILLGFNQRHGREDNLMYR